MSDPRASILIAQADSADSLSSILTQAGCRIAQTGDARLLLTEYSRLSPNLIVLDSALPGGDSFTLCARLRETSAAVPILMLVEQNDEQIERAYRVGATDVLIKPVQATMLIRRVQSLLDAQTQAEQTRSYEHRWQQTFERNRIVQLIVNPQNGQIVDANPAACAFYGYSRDEFRQKLITELDVPNASETDETTLFNFRHRTASGQFRDVKVNSSPLDYHGQTLLYLIIYDITKRRRLEMPQTEQNILAEALRNTAAALSSTLDQNAVLDRILEQINLVVPGECANVMLIEAGIARVARARGYEMRGKDAEAEINQLRLRVRDVPTLHWMIENNRALVIPNIDNYGGWLKFGATENWLKSYVAAPIRIGNYVIGFLNVDSGTANQFNSEDADHLQIFADQAAIAIRNARLFDRVRRQATEMERRVLQRTAELDYERGQMSAILDAMTEGVAYTESVQGQLQVRYVNQALVQMMGYSPADWSLHSLSLLRGKDATDEEFTTLVALSSEELLSKGYWHREARFMRKDGSEFDAITVSTAVVVPGSNTAGAVTVIRDVSQEKALQQQKERFVAYASHELRTPITNLKTRLYLMRRQPERMEEHMRVLEHVTDRMKRLVEDLLDVSRFERGVINLDFQDVVLQDLIRSLVEIQRPEAERKLLKLDLTLPDEPLHVHADSERLAQVITNLLTNAINYTASGSIAVRLTRFCDLTGSLARVEVEDTGIGIAGEHLPHIFQPFYRVISQVEGTGLGLSITKEIVELHGGEIEVTSQIGVGSNFRFWLPLIETDTSASIPQENHAHSD